MRATGVQTRNANVFFSKIKNGGFDITKNEKYQTVAATQTSAGTQPAETEIRDTVNITQNAGSATAKKEEKSVWEQIAEMQNEFDEFQRQLENAKEQGDATSKDWQIKLKCIKIAMRIMHGDIVPHKDHRFLAEHDSDMYSRAIMLRKRNDDPQKYKSIVDKEDETDNSGKADNSLESAPVTKASVSPSENDLAVVESAVPEYW